MYHIYIHISDHDINILDAKSLKCTFLAMVLMILVISFGMTRVRK